MFRSSCVRSQLFVAWNIHTVIFFFDFRFLVFFCFFFLFVLLLRVLLLAVEISFPLLLSMYSSSLFIDASKQSSMLASPLPPSVLDTYSLSLSSLGCNALCTVINFPLLWSICPSSSYHFKNGPEYLTRRISLVFIPLMRFLQQNLVSGGFLVFWDIFS